MFRKEALDLVDGYDVRYRRHHDDSDICQRMRTSGWQTHYVAESHCISIQEDTLKELAAKELRESYWYSPAESSLILLYLHLSKWTFVRAGRHILKSRFYFILVTVATWASALWTATFRTLRSSFNLCGEAIVNTPTDAVRTFFSSGMDALVFGSFLLEK